MKSSIISNKGQSLVEVLIGLGLMVVIGLVFASGLVQMKSLSARTDLSSREDKQVMNILENARSTIANQQISYGSDAGSYNLAWGGNRDIQETSTCSKPDEMTADCPGRLKYALRPVPLAGGVTQHDLYLIELKMKHLKWGNLEKTYTLMASPK